MPKVFSVASWNVEHFKDDVTRVRRVAEFLKGQHGGLAQPPDVFALFEVEGKHIFNEFMHQFPEYRFHLTEGKQTQEIFVGVHRDLQTFSTQRLEFKAQREYQRPGLLLTIRKDSKNYPLLFLHVRSGTKPEDFGLRDAALNHAFNLKKVLDHAENGAANFICLGDLNTMGIDDPVPYCKTMDFSSDEEIARIAEWARKRNMQLLGKDSTMIDGKPKEVTWYNGSAHYEPTNLDHVLASGHIDIRDAGGVANNISVFGWPKLPVAQWNDWLNQYSDHAVLYFEIW